MFTTVVGKTALESYNKKNNTKLSAKAFFDEVIFPIFFDNKKYLFWPQNSPFVQGINNKNREENTALKRLERLEKFHAKIKSGSADASVAIGYPASPEKFATTSGAVTDMEIPISSDDIYCSWIGGLLGATVEGGLLVLFDDPEINLTIIEGWKIYRKYLNDPTLSKKIPDNKIHAWNGNWLRYRYDKRFRKDFDFNLLVQLGIFQKSKDGFRIKTVKWPRMFFSLSNHFPNEMKVSYIFSLGQTNKTLGFIPFFLKDGQLLHEVYRKLFGEEDFKINKDKFEEIFGTTIQKACELGSIGLNALKPKDIEKYYGNKKNIKTKESDKIIFQTYKTWLTAMISKNKKEVSDFSRDIAGALNTFRMGDKAGSTKRKNLVEQQLLAAYQKSAFIKALTEIIDSDGTDPNIIHKMNEVRDFVHFMDFQDFKYFVLLLKFDYAFETKTKKQ